MATADFHHFKMMGRNKDLGSTEISPDGGTPAGGTDTTVGLLPCQALSGMGF